jgi:hypothetical protein
MSTTEIKDWSGATVRKVLESFDGTLSWTMISTNEGALSIAFGSGHVTTSAATTTHGAQVQAALGAYLPEEQAWVFLMKDGDDMIMIGTTRGFISELGEVAFQPDAAITWNPTITADKWTIAKDNGQKSS